MARCRWYCNYKDFSQLLIRGCFHVSASVIRLTQAGFLYVNQLFIGVFPPKKISLLHANVAALPPPWHRCHTRAGAQVIRSASRTRHHRVSTHLQAPGSRFCSAVLRRCADSCAPCAAVIFFWKLDMLLRGLSHLVRASVMKNPFEPVTETRHTSVLLPADTDWIKGRNDTRREQRIQPESP